MRPPVLVPNAPVEVGRGLSTSCRVGRRDDTAGVLRKRRSFQADAAISTVRTRRTRSSIGPVTSRCQHHKALGRQLIPRYWVLVCREVSLGYGSAIARTTTTMARHMRLLRTSVSSAATSSAGSGLCSLGVGIVSDPSKWRISMDVAQTPGITVDGDGRRVLDKVSRGPFARLGRVNQARQSGGS
jgi:hypothetical protein